MQYKSLSHLPKESNKTEGGQKLQLWTFTDEDYEILKNYDISFIYFITLTDNWLKELLKEPLRIFCCRKTAINNLFFVFKNIFILMHLTWLEIVINYFTRKRKPVRICVAIFSKFLISYIKLILNRVSTLDFMCNVEASFNCMFDAYF